MDISDLIGASAVLGGVITGLLAFWLSFRYQKFFWPFTFLAISFLAYGLAELVFYLLDTYGIQPYGSIADIFYTFYFVFAILHVVATLRNLRIKYDLKHMILAMMLFGGLIVIYILVTFYENEVIIDRFLFGGIFVTMASTLAAFALIALLKCMNTILMKSWMVIGISLITVSFTDVWYYTQENITGYQYGQFPLMDILYFTSDLLMIVGLIYHWKKI